MVHDPRGPAPRLGDDLLPASLKKNPLEQVKWLILQDRLQLGPLETLAWLESLQREAAQQLGVPPSAITLDTEFHGREMDLIFTIDRQNLPPVRRRA